MSGEVVSLFPSGDLEEGSIVTAQDYGIIGDNYIYPGNKIKILKVLSGEYCDTQHHREHPSCVEIIIEGGILKTTRENLLKILSKSKELPDIKRATS